MIEKTITAIGSTSLQAFSQLWNAKRKMRRLPCFDDFSKTELQRFLNQLIVSKRQYGRSYYIFVGSHIARVSHMDFSGYYLDEIDFLESETTNWEEIHSRILTDQEAIAGSCMFPLSTGEIKQYATAVFPFSTDGRNIDYILSLEDWFSVGNTIGPEVLDKAPPVQLRT